MFIKRALADLRRPGPEQIGALDALRTMAVLLVMNGHYSVGFADTFGHNWYSKLSIVQNGWIGVDLFFVLSGFFIGGQLWKELKRTNTVSFKQFFLRRGLRIWPLYFSIFALVFIFDHSKAVSKGFGWSDLVFVSNYIDSGIVTGSWTLSTEEQFYILAPLAIIFSAPLLKTVEKYRPLLWMLLFAAPVLRTIIWYIYGHGSFAANPDVFAKVYYPLHGHCDGLIAGMLISNYSLSKPKWSAGKSAALLGTAVVLSGALHVTHKGILDFTALSVVFAAMAWIGLNHREMPIVNSRLFYWGSRLSYGMYLMHPYLIHGIVNELGKLPVAQGVTTQLLGTAIFTAVCALCATIGYCLIEHPFLELRSKILARQKEAARAVTAPARS